MKRIQDFKNIKPINEYPKIIPGGYVCRITGVKDYFEKEYLKKCKMFLGKKIGKKSKKRDILLALFRQFAVYEKAEEEDPSAQDMFKALDELIFCCKKDIKDAYDR